MAPLDNHQNTSTNMIFPHIVIRYLGKLFLWKYLMVVQWFHLNALKNWVLGVEIQ